MKFEEDPSDPIAFVFLILFLAVWILLYILPPGTGHEDHMRFLREKERNKTTLTYSEYLKLHDKE